MQISEFDVETLGFMAATYIAVEAEVGESFITDNAHQARAMAYEKDLECKEAHSADARTLADHLNKAHGYNFRPLKGRAEAGRGSGYRGMDRFLQNQHRVIVASEKAAREAVAV